MGLFKFLKDKFSKKNEKEEAAIVAQEFVKEEELADDFSHENEEIKENLEDDKIVSLDKREVEMSASFNDVKRPIETAKPIDVKGSNTKKENKKKSRDELAEIKKYDKGMEKSRKGFADKLNNLSKKYKKVNQEYFEDLEEVLIEADVGVTLTLKVVEQLADHAKSKKISSVQDLNEELIDLLFASYMKNEQKIEKELIFKDNSLTTCLVVGVNGVGKTTSIAKLAYRYKKFGKKVMIVAADTFRAGAVEQLSIWAKRIDVEIITGKQNQDPASVVFDGVKKAKENGADLLIIDTAGRLQTKVNLMNELNKISKVISSECPDAVRESLLVLDATTGQNGVIQAKAFFEVTQLSGIVITKMDGTSKGGIILAIRDELGIPVRFIGLGETLDDLQLFDLEKYLYALCIGE